MPIPGEGRRVWIVDDSPLDAERARRALSADYAVEVFPDGSAALEALATRQPPDVMVLDWVMPGISGLDVCRFLRSEGTQHAQIAVVLLTVHRQVEQVVEGLSAGANDYLPKPYELEELRARVSAQVRSRELLDRATRAETLNRHLLESSPDPLLAVDSLGRLTYANLEACGILRASRSALTGRPLAELIPTLAPFTLDDGEQESYRLLPDVDLEGRTYSPTMRRLPQSDAASVTVSLRDVTDRRRTEARRLDFYSIIAHDLRSPLNTMALRTQLILGGRHGGLPEGLREDLHKIERNIHSLVEMINDFLEMARVEATPLKVDQKPVDAVALVDRVLEAFRPLLENGQLEAQRVAPEHPADGWVIGDPKRLTQVMTNLISNAIKFTPARGVVRTAVRRSGEWVEIGIEDTGPGVPPEALPTLFDRYTQALPTHSEVAGSGLGLMIVRQIVEAHGGSVGVEPNLPHGSRFWVRLPGTRDPSPAA
jgi:signal transduction histidine kinase